TSYVLPDNHSTASCWVAGITKPSAPTRSSSNPTTPGGASRGIALRHSSGLNPATRLTPPIVVLGSRSDEMQATSSRPSCPAARSTSRYACDAVPSAKIPPCGLLTSATLHPEPPRLVGLRRLASRQPERQRRAAGTHGLEHEHDVRAHVGLRHLLENGGV